MTKHRQLTAAAPWVELVATADDWDAADPALLTTMLNELVLIRTFEEYVLELSGAGLIHGPAHSSIGQEGGAVGSILALTTEDAVNGSHRGHHQFLAKALSHVTPKGLDLTQELTGDVRTVLLRTLAEICGLARGYSHGRGGSMHLQWKEAGAMGTNAFVGVGVRGDLREFDDAHLADRDSYTGETAEQKFIDAVAAVMARRMQTDKTIVVMGEDVHRLNGGTNGATRGLKEAYPDRVLGTPICENAFAGLGGGIALDGRFKPVVEFMYADFMWVAADQLFNQIGKARHMFGGDGDVPFVLRSKVAMGTGYGSQHSMDPAGIFATAPGWRIVAPSTPFDYVGLMNSALRCKDPVVVLEHVDLYTSTGEGPVGDLDYCLPVGRAAVRRTGSQITVISYLSMVHHVLSAVTQVGNVDAEVIDLRWLDRASIDWDTIGESIKKTNNVLIAEQGALGTSYGGWLADEIQRRFFDWLDQPVQRVTGREASPSISKVLERAAIAKSEEVAARLAEITES